MWVALHAGARAPGFNAKSKDLGFHSTWPLVGDTESNQMSVCVCVCAHTCTCTRTHGVEREGKGLGEGVSKILTECRKFYTEYKRNKLSRVIPKEGEGGFLESANQHVSTARISPE